MNADKVVYEVVLEVLKKREKANGGSIGPDELVDQVCAVNPDILPVSVKIVALDFVSRGIAILDGYWRIQLAHTADTI